MNISTMKKLLLFIFLLDSFFAYAGGCLSSEDNSERIVPVDHDSNFDSRQRNENFADVDLASISHVKKFRNESFDSNRVNLNMEPRFQKVELHARNKSDLQGIMATTKENMKEQFCYLHNTKHSWRKNHPLHGQVEIDATLDNFNARKQTVQMTVNMQEVVRGDQESTICSTSNDIHITSPGLFVSLVRNGL